MGWLTRWGARQRRSFLGDDWLPASVSLRSRRGGRSALGHGRARRFARGLDASLGSRAGRVASLAGRARRFASLAGWARRFAHGAGAALRSRGGRGACVGLVREGDLLQGALGAQGGSEEPVELTLGMGGEPVVDGLTGQGVVVADLGA